MNVNERQQLSNVIFNGGGLLCLLGLAVGTWALFFGFGAMVVSLFVGPSLVESIEAQMRSKDLDRRLRDNTRATATDGATGDRHCPRTPTPRPSLTGRCPPADLTRPLASCASLRS